MIRYLPINLDLSGRKILVVGSGSVALQKLKALGSFKCEITVIGPEASRDIKDSAVKIISREYSASVLEGFHLVYACTNNRELNRKIKEDAGGKGILVNVVDDAELSDFISPAVYSEPPMTVAVSSSGRDVRKTIRWRDKIRELFKNDSA